MAVIILPAALLGLPVLIMTGLVFCLAYYASLRKLSANIQSEERKINYVRLTACSWLGLIALDLKNGLLYIAANAGGMDGL